MQLYLPKAAGEGSLVRRLAGLRASVAVLAALGMGMLTACNGSVSAQDVADTSQDVGSKVVDTYLNGVDALTQFGRDLGQALSDGDLSAISAETFTCIVVRDAATGEELAEVSDKDAIDAAFAGFSDVGADSISASADGLTPEYELELWQKQTVKLGESPDRVADMRAGSITTYQGSDVVTLKVGEGKILSADVTVPTETAEALRALAAGDVA